MIKLHLPWLPPSVNHAYVNRPGGGRILSVAGKKFKRETSTWLVLKYRDEIKGFGPDIPYGLAVQFVLADLYNKTWPDKAATRYKKVDVSNRLKLLEDAVVDALGIDDSQFLTIALSKVAGTQEETWMWIWNAETEKPSQSIPPRSSGRATEPNCSSSV